MDGSVEGSLARTAWALSELIDLDCPPDHAGVVRTLGYVLSRQDAPGHFGEGCEPDRHAARTCRHHLGGFFSAGSGDEEVAPLVFPWGTTVSDENQARFAVSCFALRVVLRLGEDRRPAVRKHVESLLSLENLWSTWSEAWIPTATFTALAALQAAPIEYRSVTEQGLNHVVAHQRKDGTWPDVDLIHAVDALVGHASPIATRTIKRAVPALISEWQPDERFDSLQIEEQALIHVRALHRASGEA